MHYIEEEKEHIEDQEQTDFCEFTRISANSCESLRIRANFCEFAHIYILNNSGDDLQLPFADIPYSKNLRFGEAWS